mgnify:CR=1 FL=1
MTFAELVDAEVVKAHRVVADQPHTAVAQRPPRAQGVDPGGDLLVGETGRGLTFMGRLVDGALLEAGIGESPDPGAGPRRPIELGGRPFDLSTIERALDLAIEFEDDQVAKNCLFLLSETAVRHGDTFRARRYLRELTAYYPEVGISEEIIDVFLSTDLTSVVNLRG